MKCTSYAMPDKQNGKMNNACMTSTQTHRESIPTNKKVPYELEVTNVDPGGVASCMMSRDGSMVESRFMFHCKGSPHQCFSPLHRDASSVKFVYKKVSLRNVGYNS